MIRQVPDRGLLKDFPFFAGKRKGSASEGKDAHQALLLLQAFEASGHGWFWSVDQDGCLTYISESLAQALGDTSALLLGKPFSNFLAQADDDLTGRRTLPFVLAKQSPFEKLALRPAKGGEERCWAVSGSPQFDETGRFTGYLGSAIDITEQRSSSERASQLAKYDPLTGLPNRRRMADLLDTHLAGAEHHHRSCAVMLIDLDRFKQVNDTLGHPAGDALLKQVAERLARIVGDKERVFRLGGDEFQVILPNCEDRGIIGTLASEIIANLSQPYSVEGSRCIIGASIGVAVAPADGRTRAELIRNADLALYGSKSGGRGRFRFFSTELLEAAEDKRALEEDLRDALARGEMSLAYQPIVNAQTNQITGVEALLRWNHPRRGPVSPALFVPIAEEAGIVGQLGDWALRQACADAATWPGKLRVAVNVSPVQFNGEALPATVTSALAASGLPPERLELEITEGVFLGDTPSADAMFAALKGVGVRLALDDFGTGYSSLGYLRTAPFDKIKIDQTFVREATQPGSRNGAIIAAIVALAEALDMETTAEGIEYMDQLDLMRSLRVSHIQGWVYSKAISSAELALRLQDGNWTISPSGPATQRSNRQAVYRKVGVIHGNRYRSAIMRNLSATGALIDGMEQLPLQAMVVVDFGDGQLTFARVVRATGRQLGLTFEQELVDDGDGGLCTSHRVSPYTLATIGLPNPGDPDKDLGGGQTPGALNELAERLGLKLGSRPEPAAPVMNLQWSSAQASGGTPTFGEISERYLDSLFGDEQAREGARRDLHDHILPEFGQLRLDQVGESDFLTWLASKNGPNGSGGSGPDSHRLMKLLARMWTLAVDLKLADAKSNPLEGSLRFDRRARGDALLSAEEAHQLLLAALASPNRQLKYIISLLMLTGARTGEILNVRWEHVDLAAGVWRVHVAGAETMRELRLTGAAVNLLRELPRFENCGYVVPNPATRKPYRTLTQSWDVVKVKAMLPHLELDDLRYCDLGTAIWEERLFGLLQHDEEGEPIGSRA
jgi:diguanylate cyclase (GGDEF)-like protein/PAS domain S-box-containing protein